MYACVVALAWVTAASGHGVVLTPMSRSRVGHNMSIFIPDYNEDGLNCGGIGNSDFLAGRCGICGDPYRQKKPRDHELGGKYGDGVIVANYKPGSKIQIEVLLTAHHKGFWEFRLCDDPSRNDQGCFKRVLKLENGNTKYYPVKKPVRDYYKVRYVLPSNFRCRHCVLQWMYTAGNNWGVCANGTGALGCGIQEQFRACSDVSITDGEVWDYKPDKVLKLDGESAWHENRIQALMSGQPKPTEEYATTKKSAHISMAYINRLPIYENKRKKLNKNKKARVTKRADDNIN